MEIKGICNICGKPGKMYTCSLCGNNVCINCYNLPKRLCKPCKRNPVKMI